MRDNYSIANYHSYKNDYLRLKQLHQVGGANILQESDYLLTLIESNLDKPLSDIDFLEVGGGDFSLTLPLAFYFNSHTGIEKRKRMVRMAEHRIGFQRIPNARIIRADIDELEFDPESTYDVIYMRNAFHLIDHERIFQTLLQILNPGGLLFIEQTESKPIIWADKRFV
jgi:trans-aconitate methyltransferase